MPGGTRWKEKCFVYKQTVAMTDRMELRRRMTGPSSTTDQSIDKSELFELMVESAADFAIFTLDVHGNTTSWNAGSERLFGYTEREMVGASADVLFTAADRQRVAPERERLRARVEGRAVDERWHLRKDGSQFWASGLMMPLKNGAGFVKITRDLTEQHLTHTRLQENEERFRLLATSIPQLVFRTRPDGHRTWGSPQWISFTGLNLQDSLGEGWLGAIHPDDLEATRAGWRAALSSGEYYVEHRVRRVTDGEYRWYQTRARPVLTDNPEADWVGTMTDIHDLRALKDRQQVLVAELQHRTRNLLAVVQSIAKQMIRKTTSLQSFGIEFQSRLRALSRVQSLLAGVDPSDVDLEMLLRAELAAHDADMAGAKISVTGPAVTLPASSAQALALALHELATNAVKYGAMAQPSGKLSVSWRIDARENDSTVTLEWRETGVTMVDAQQQRRRGYGSELIEHALPYQLGARTRLEFSVDGVYCEVVVPVQQRGGQYG
jgi:PAS domain S-box-containing protein